MLTENPLHVPDDAEAIHRAPGFTLATYERGTPGRGAAEQFVREGFFRTHQACVQSFLPTLLAISDADGRIGGVVGCRFAAHEALFLERYLEAPIEEVLARHTGVQVSRDFLVEVGNLSCRNSRFAQHLIAVLPRYLLGRGCTWVAFTATSSIRRILRHAGARTVVLARAEAMKVADSGEQWGRYYDNDPRVMAGYLPSARRNPALWNAPHAD